jgi:hypothetical protein
MRIPPPWPRDRQFCNRASVNKSTVSGGGVPKGTCRPTTTQGTVFDRYLSNDAEMVDSATVLNREGAPA